MGTGRDALTAGQILLHPLPHANSFLVPGAPQLTGAFSPCLVHPTFYPDLTKPARLTTPFPPLPRLEPARCWRREIPPPTTSPAPLLLTPAPQLLCISKARAADNEPHSEPAAASLNGAHSLRHGHHRF